MNEVPGAVELPEEKREAQNTHMVSLFITANEYTHLDLLDLSAIIYRLSHDSLLCTMSSDILTN